MKVDMIVPPTAYRLIVQKLAKNDFFLSEYPASNMMGGRRRKKNSSGSKERNSSSSLEGNSSRARPPTSIPTNIAAAESGT